MPQPSDQVSLGSADWVDRYEVVRSRALEDGTNGSGWGLALLVDRGVVAWMRAWPAGSVGAREPESPAKHLSDSSMPVDSLPPSLPSVSYQQLAAVLASMILETRKEIVQ